MCWRKVIVTGSLDTGAVHDALENSTRSGSESANEPFVNTPGSLTESAASPAVDTTFADVEAMYSLSTPVVNGPKDAGPRSVSVSVAGTDPPTAPSVLVAAYAAEPELAL